MVHNFKVDAGFFHFLAKFSLIVNIHELYETSTTSGKHYNSIEYTANCHNYIFKGLDNNESF